MGAMTIEDLFSRAARNISDINEHLPRMRQLGETCQHITEFGVRAGVSTVAWLAAHPKVLVCYDIQKHAEVDQLAALAADTGVSFTFHLQNVLEASIAPTDLLFIDTLHTYDQLKQELARHSDKARKYIVLHDTEHFGTTGELPTRGLWPAVAAFLAANSTWRLLEKHPNNNGLTVLARMELP
jgi:methyltransferase family protein